MYYGYYNSDKTCRWDSRRYKGHKPIGRDGFCCAACKQAHHRAYKKYVTTRSRSSSKISTSSVTPKKLKICPLCNKKAIRIVNASDHKLYIHKESTPIEPPDEHGTRRARGGRSCIVPTPKKQKKRK